MQNQSTRTDQAEKPVMPPSPESLVIALAAQVNQEIGQNLAIYEAAAVELENIDRNEERFEKAVEASQADVAADGLKLQELLRSDSPDPKDDGELCRCAARLVVPLRLRRPRSRTRRLCR